MAAQKRASQPSLPSDAQQEASPNTQIASGTIGTVFFSKQTRNADQPSFQHQSARVWVIRNPQGLIASDVIERNGWRVSKPGKSGGEIHEEQEVQEVIISVPDYAPCGKNYSIVLYLSERHRTNQSALEESREEWTGYFDVVRQLKHLTHY